MPRPLLLDTFCGVGGAAHGYWRAGFDVVGVDIRPQPDYPYRFIQGDAVEYLKAHGHEYDAIHASPPCQGYSSVRSFTDVSKYPTLVEPVRDALVATGLPWVIENVVGAPLIDPVLVCGASLGVTALDERDGRALVLRRHRLFESNVPLAAPVCECAEYVARGYRIAGVYGRGVSKGTTWHRGYVPYAATRRALMGIHWTRTSKSVSEAIPPAYAQLIGGQLIGHVQAQG